MCVTQCACIPITITSESHDTLDKRIGGAKVCALFYFSCFYNIFSLNLNMSLYLMQPCFAYNYENDDDNVFFLSCWSALTAS